MRSVGASSVRFKNWRASKPKKQSIFKVFYNIRMHASKLTSVAFVKNKHYALFVNFMARVAAYKPTKLLNSGYNKPAFFRIVF